MAKKTSTNNKVVVEDTKPVGQMPTRLHHEDEPAKTEMIMTHVPAGVVQAANIAQECSEEEQAKIKVAAADALADQQPKLLDIPLTYDDALARVANEVIRRSKNGKERKFTADNQADVELVATHGGDVQNELIEEVRKQLGWGVKVEYGPGEVVDGQETMNNS